LKGKNKMNEVEKMNDTDFNNLMEDINKNFQDKNIPIPSRELLAMLEVAKRFKIEIYMGDKTDQRINQWFKSRFNDKLNIPFIGQSIVLIKGDPYKLNIPLIYGGNGAQLICSGDQNLKIGQNLIINPTSINVLNFIEGMTFILSTQLNSEDKKEIIENFQKSHYMFKMIDDLKMKKKKNILQPNEILCYLDEAIGDIRESSNHILQSNNNFGLSKWSSMQFVEKIMKSYIATYINLELPSNRTIKHTHDLTSLNNILKNYGINDILQNSLDKIQGNTNGKPDLRYNKNKLVNLNEAADAHQNSIEVVSIILEKILFP
jgi:hypothetical protein